MSERGVQVSVARIRAGGPFPAEAAVRSALGTVMDPELPMVSIVDLGMVGAVTVGDSIRVEVAPTFVGCPALELIEAAVAERLAPFGRPVEIVRRFDPPWTSDDISATGLDALRRAGIAPPIDASAIRCPYCGSDRVVMDSLFGPTQCRSLLYCRACRQPFEALKRV